MILGDVVIVKTPHFLSLVMTLNDKDFLKRHSLFDGLINSIVYKST